MGQFSPEELRARAAARTAAREGTATTVTTSNIFTDGGTSETNDKEEPLVDDVKVSNLVEVVEETSTTEETSATILMETRDQEEAAKAINQAAKLIESMKEAQKEPGFVGPQSTGLSYPGAHSHPEVEITEDVNDEVEVNLESKPSLADATVFQKLTTTSTETGIDGGDSYAELVENLISSQCQMSGVKNLDLTTFGLRAQVLSFPNLTVIEYGTHKFLGAPFTEEEENMIIHRLGLHVAQSDKDKIVVRAVQEVQDSRGMSFYSLLFNDRIAQRFADMFNYTVHANLREPDVSKLVLVIQK